MKTLQFFKDEIPSLVAQMEGVQIEINKEKRNTELSKLRRQKKLLKKKIEFYRFCRLYIETDPKEEFVTQEVNRLSNRINMYMKEYVPLDEEKNLKKVCADHKKKYEKEMGIPHIRTQLTTLYFILK